MRAFDYSRTRFARASQILRGEPTALCGWVDTPNHRLWLAVLEVYACTHGHFCSVEDYHRFADLMADLRERSPSRQLFEAVRDLPAEQCARFIEELLSIAETTVMRLAVVPWSQDSAASNSASEGA